MLRQEEDGDDEEEDAQEEEALRVVHVVVQLLTWSYKDAGLGRKSCWKATGFSRCETVCVSTQNNSVHIRVR